MEQLYTSFSEKLDQLMLSQELMDDLPRIYIPLANIINVGFGSRMQVIGVNGAQGAGKSTFCQLLKLVLEEKFGKKVASWSIDDLYLSRKERKRLSEEVHPLLMTRGVSIDFLRKNHFNKKDDLADDILLELVDSHAVALIKPVDPIAKTDLKIMLEHISADDLTLLIGKYYLGLDTNDLAAISGLTSTAVRSRVHRAKNKLFDKWKATGLTMEDFIYG